MMDEFKIIADMVANLQIEITDAQAYKRACVAKLIGTNSEEPAQAEIESLAASEGRIIAHILLKDTLPMLRRHIKPLTEHDVNSRLIMLSDTSLVNYLSNSYVCDIMASVGRGGPNGHAAAAGAIATDNNNQLAKLQNVATDELMCAYRCAKKKEGVTREAAIEFVNSWLSGGEPDQKHADELKLHTWCVLAFDAAHEVSKIKRDEFIQIANKFGPWMDIVPEDTYMNSKSGDTSIRLAIYMWNSGVKVAIKPFNNIIEMIPRIERDKRMTKTAQEIVAEIDRMYDSKQYPFDEADRAEHQIRKVFPATDAMFDDLSRDADGYLNPEPDSVYRRVAESDKIMNKHRSLESSKESVIRWFTFTTNHTMDSRAMTRWSRSIDQIHTTLKSRYESSSSSSSLSQSFEEMQQQQQEEEEKKGTKRPNVSPVGQMEVLISFAYLKSRGADSELKNEFAMIAARCMREIKCDWKDKLGIREKIRHAMNDIILGSKAMNENLSHLLADCAAPAFQSGTTYKTIIGGLKPQDNVLAVHTNLRNKIAPYLVTKSGDGSSDAAKKEGGGGGGNTMGDLLFQCITIARTLLRARVLDHVENNN